MPRKKLGERNSLSKNDLVRVSHSRRLVQDPNDPSNIVVECEQKTYRYNEFLHEFPKKPESVVTYEPISQREGVKKLTVQFVEIRSNVDRNTLETISGKFLHKVDIQVLDVPDNKWLYLTTYNGRVFMNNLNEGTTIELSHMQMLSKQSWVKVTISKGKMISDKQFLELKKAKAIFPIPVTILQLNNSIDVRIDIGSGA